MDRANSTDHANHRKEPRLSIGAKALLRSPNGGDTYQAITVNVSPGGMLLRVTEAHPFRVGDDILCEVAVPNDPEQAFASWGIGRIVRLDRSTAAVELRAETF
ncbi:MAG TPA: PilZ domain-containing protein [Bryobacteraceae bacterium]|jgi:hypothetical protein|nr:PilZ domain-containing protein [Bryobacteraceae bacterium]